MAEEALNRVSLQKVLDIFLNSSGRGYEEKLQDDRERTNPLVVMLTFKTPFQSIQAQFSHLTSFQTLIEEGGNKKVEILRAIC